MKTKKGHRFYTKQISPHDRFVGKNLVHVDKKSDIYDEDFLSSLKFWHVLLSM